MRGKLEQYLSASDTGGQLYLLAFLINLLGESLSTTMFHVPGNFLLLIKFVTIVLIGIKLLWFDSLGKKEVLYFAGLMSTAILIWIFSGYSEVFMWGILLIGAQNVPFRKILLIYIVINFVVVFLAFSSSLLGVIENLQYTGNGNRGIRNSFGIVYTTDFAAHIFYLMLAYFYLKSGKIKKWDYIGAGIIAVLVYYFCNARLDVICMSALIGGYLYIAYKKRRAPYLLKNKYTPKKGYEKYGIYAMPVAATLMMLLTVLYGKLNILDQLDILLSSRLRFGLQGLEQFGIRLFGQYVLMVGNGNTTKQPLNYFFVDCSYLYVLLRYGIIFLLILLGVYVACCRKYCKDVYFILTIALISLNCMIAHHIIEPAYNPFAFALLAAMDKRENLLEKRNFRC